MRYFIEEDRKLKAGCPVNNLVKQSILVRFDLDLLGKFIQGNGFIIINKPVA